MKSVLGSPLITNPLRSTLGFFTAKDVKLSRFASNFYLSKTSLINAHVTDSRFSRFMSSVVKISSEDIVNKTFFTGYKYVDDSSVYIGHCIFKYCNDPTAGGAIYIGFPLSFYPNLTLSTNLFKNCSALRGGAICGGGQHPLFSKNCFCCCEAFDRSHAFLVYTSKGSTNMNLTTINSCPGSDSSAQNVATVIRNVTIFTGLNVSSNAISSDGLFVNNINTAYSCVQYGRFQNNIGDSGFVFRNASRLFLMFVVVSNNTVSQLFLATNSDYVTNVTISKSIFFKNMYNLGLKSANGMNYTVSNKISISVQNSNVDNESMLIMKRQSNILSESGDPMRVFYTTHFFFTEGCNVKLATAAVYSKTLVSKKTLMIIFGTLSFTAIAAVFCVIIYFIMKKKDEENWLLSHQEGLCD